MLPATARCNVAYYLATHSERRCDGFLGLTRLETAFYFDNLPTCKNSSAMAISLCSFTASRPIRRIVSSRSLIQVRRVNAFGVVALMTNMKRWIQLALDQKQGYAVSEKLLSFSPNPHTPIAMVISPASPFPAIAIGYERLRQVFLDNFLRDHAAFRFSLIWKTAANLSVVSARGVGVCL